MREFIYLALKARTTADFDIEELADTKVDQVCRMVSNCLWISKNIRRDTVIHAALTGPKEPPKLITFKGLGLSQDIKADEISIARVISKALRAGVGLKLNEEKEAMPGVIVSKKAFETVAKEKSKTSQMFYLHPEGKDIREVEFKENVTIMLGDFIGLPKNTIKLIERLGAQKLSLGPKMLFATHCPILVHNEMDRREHSK